MQISQAWPAHGLFPVVNCTEPSPLWADGERWRGDLDLGRGKKLERTTREEGGQEASYWVFARGCDCDEDGRRGWPAKMESG